MIILFCFGSGSAEALSHVLGYGIRQLVQYIKDQYDRSAIHFAAFGGESMFSRHKDIILLLSKGMDVDVSNDNGSPPDHAGIAIKHDTVKVPLDHGANPNVVLYSTFTPLYSSIYAKWPKSWQCVEALLKVEMFFYILVALI
ncbi:hypothetical protein MKX03_010203 [Papaver bracteatum]|nr:hypothetical protein MKX03_010203 [Papaver bracteatum]